MSTVNPPAPKMRSSWLTKALADEPGPSTGKKSLGAALVAQSKADFVHNHAQVKKSMGAGLKRKSDVEDDDRSRKVFKASHGSSLTKDLPPKPAASVQPVQQDILVPTRDASEDESDDEEGDFDEEDATSFDKLKEHVGKYKEHRAKSLYGGEIDITTRFNIPITTSAQADLDPSASASSMPTPPIVTANLPRERSLQRLSVSELISSSEIQMMKEREKVVQEYERKGDGSGFNLLNESKSTTPPHSPPPLPKKNSLPRSAPKVEKTRRSKESESAKVIAAESAVVAPPRKVSDKMLEGNIFEAALKRKPSVDLAPTPAAPRYDQVFAANPSVAPVTRKGLSTQPLSTQASQETVSTDRSSFGHDSIFSQDATQPPGWGKGSTWTGSFSDLGHTQPTEYEPSQELQPLKAKEKESSQDAAVVPSASGTQEDVGDEFDDEDEMDVADYVCANDVGLTFLNPISFY